MKTFHVIFTIIYFLPFIINTLHLTLENQSTVENLPFEPETIDDDTTPTYIPISPIIYKPVEEPEKQGMCRCGVFDALEPTKVDRPVVTEELFKLNCDEEGKDKCKKLCATLAKLAVENHGMDVLCTSIVHYYNLMPSVHSQLCNEEKWAYTGLTARKGICCHLFQLIDCGRIYDVDTGFVIEDKN